MIIGPNVVSITKSGTFWLRTTRSDGVVLLSKADLDSRQPYVAGETEKAMLEQLLFDRLIQTDNTFSWILEQAKL